MYFCILDFEATCIEEKIIPNQEIIEFPSILYKYDSSKRTINKVDEFHKYIKPTFNPILSTFCTNLTHITQEKVDNGESFEDVYRLHKKWLSKSGIKSSKDIIFVISGEWDLRVMLPNNLKLLGIKMNNIYKNYINIKDEFKKFYNHKPHGINDMLNYLDMKFEGHLHSGIDDTRNISRVFEKMIEDGYQFNIETSI